MNIIGCCVCRFAVRPVMGLEFSQYLENYLWQHFTVERVTEYMYKLIKA